jgi:hypothetical protein
MAGGHCSLPYRHGHRAAGSRAAGGCRAACYAGGAGGMTGLLGIIAGVAAVLAVLALVVTSLFIGVCLAVARITDAVRGRGRRGASSERDARSVAPSPASGRRRDASGEHVASGRGGW